jgi:hypothetical protein
MKNTLGYYRIEYESGTVQLLPLITKDTFEIIKELRGQKSDLEVQIKTLKSKKKHIDHLVPALLDINKQLKEYPNNFFVYGSPMFTAITTGVIDISDPKSGNFGQYPVTITKIEDTDNGVDNEEMESEVID